MDRAVVTDTVKIGALNAAGKIAGTAKTIVIAHYFGAGDALDAYLLAFVVPAFFADVLSGSLTSSFLPAYIQAHEKRPAEAEALFGTIQRRALLALLIIAVALVALPPSVLHLLAQGFSDSKIALTRKLMWIMLATLPLSALNVPWRAVLNAQHRFTVAALSPLAVPVVIIAALLAAGSGGIHVLAAGTTAGAIFESLLLFIAVRRSGLAAFPRAGNAPDLAARTMAQYWPAAAGTLCSRGSVVVDQAMAATLGTGSVATLNYGIGLAGMLVSVGPAALGTAVFPRLARMSSSGDFMAVKRKVRNYAIASIVLTLPVIAIGMFAAEPIVRLLFERGAFNHANTRAAAAVQSVSMLQIPFSVLLALLAPLASSLRKNQWLFRLAVLSLGLNIVLDIAFMRWWGVPGLALSTAVLQMISSTVLIVLLARYGAARRTAAG